MINCFYGDCFHVHPGGAVVDSLFLLWYRLRHYTISLTPHCAAQAKKETLTEEKRSSKKNCSNCIIYVPTPHRAQAKKENTTGGKTFKQETAAQV